MNVSKKEKDVEVTNNSGIVNFGTKTHNTVIHNNGASVSQNIDWVTLEKELLEFMKKDNLDSIKQTSEEALEAIREKKFDKFKNILIASGKIGLEIFSKVTGTMLAEIAKKLMTP